VSENDFDEQWRIQQEQLAARRVVLDRDHLKDKHKGGGGGGGVQTRSTEASQVEEDDEDTFQEEDKKKASFGGFRFPWDTK